MAWTTCPHCGAKTNGYYATAKHATREHPAEVALAEARQQVGWAEFRLAEHIRAEEEHEVLEDMLSQDMPQLAQDILTAERDKRKIKKYLNGVYVEVPFSVQIADDAARLAQMQAALAALQQEVTA